VGITTAREKIIIIMPLGFSLENLTLAGGKSFTIFSSSTGFE
jgi:hypothetical protein